jgi:molybdopterin converting factor small subunit
MKKRHIQTNFIKFIIEKYSNDQEPQTDIEDDEEIQIQDEEPEKPLKTQTKKTDRELEKEDEDLEGTNDDDIIDELVQEYQKIKKAYENRRLHNRRKR